MVRQHLAMPFTHEQSKLYLASKMNDSRYPYVEVEVPVPEKKQKYKRYQHEKRVNHPGTKRVQSPRITVTKWDVENANTRNKKVERNRDRAEKYGNWSENRTEMEDVKEKDHKKEKDQLAKRVIRNSLAELGELMFPVFSMDNQGSWPIWAWESYHEHLEYESYLAEERAIAWNALINSPEQIAINATNEQTAVIEGDCVYDIDLDTDDDYETDDDM